MVNTIYWHPNRFFSPNLTLSITPIFFSVPTSSNLLYLLFCETYFHFDYESYHTLSFDAIIINIPKSVNFAVSLQIFDESAEPNHIVWRVYSMLWLSFNYLGVIFWSFCQNRLNKPFIQSNHNVARIFGFANSVCILNNRISYHWFAYDWNADSVE